MNTLLMMLATWAAVDLRRFFELDPTHHFKKDESNPRRISPFRCRPVPDDPNRSSDIESNCFQGIVHFFPDNVQ